MYWKEVELRLYSFFNLRAREWRVFNAIRRRLYIWEETRHRRLGGFQWSVWTCKEIQHRDSISGPWVRRKLLGWWHYPGPLTRVQKLLGKLLSVCWGKIYSYALPISTTVRRWTLSYVTSVFTVIFSETNFYNTLPYNCYTVNQQKRAFFWFTL